MKVEITERGVFDAKGKRIEVGAVLTVKGDEIPAYLVNKCRVVSPSKPVKAAAVTNPAEKPVQEPQAD